MQVANCPCHTDASAIKTAFLYSLLALPTILRPPHFLTFSRPGGLLFHSIANYALRSHPPQAGLHLVVSVPVSSHPNRPGPPPAPTRWRHTSCSHAAAQPTPQHAPCWTEPPQVPAGQKQIDTLSDVLGVSSTHKAVLAVLWCVVESGVLSRF